MQPERLFDQSFYFDVVHISATLLLIFFLAAFIIAIIRMVMDHRIKKKLLEQGAPDAIVAQLLQSAPRENRNNNIKWACMLAGIGIGLTLVDHYQPLGIHSLAIMSFALAAAFLAYHLLTKNSRP